MSINGGEPKKNNSFYYPPESSSEVIIRCQYNLQSERVATLVMVFSKQTIHLTGVNLNPDGSILTYEVEDRYKNDERIYKCTTSTTSIQVIVSYPNKQSKKLVTFFGDACM